MTKTHIIEAESLAFLAIAATVGFVFAYYSHYSLRPMNFSTPILAPLTSPTPSIFPTPTQAVETFSQLSPDGTKKVNMTITTEKTGNKTYRFTVSNPDGSSVQQIYEVTLPSNESMNIPYNTFSPDDKYIFLNHMINGLNEAWIFQSDGTSLGQHTYDNATAIFKTKINPTISQTATGWASDTLLIILTYNADGSEGTSYWLEVPSTAIIPLATQF